MPPIRPELLDELLKDYQKPEDLLVQDWLLQQPTKALAERALDGELTQAPKRPLLPRSELNARQPKSQNVPSKTAAKPSTL